MPGDAKARRVDRKAILAALDVAVAMVPTMWRLDGTPIERFEYGRRCAPSSEKTPPVLDADHICSSAKGGEHDVANGPLLRTDIHTRFDQGHVKFIDDLRFAASDRLEAHPDSGVHDSAMQGRHLSFPDAAY